MTALTRVRAGAAALALVALGATAAPAGAAEAAAAPPFAPAARAQVHPGVQTLTVVRDDAGRVQRQQCTANFVFTAGSRVLLGQSAHCAGLGDPTETDGCGARTAPLGTRVEVRGATRPGRLVYSSWIAMQRARERDRAACRYNDFALVELSPVDVRRTNPSVPVFGGPTGLGTRAPLGTRVATFGNSSLRFGARALSPKDGWSLGTTAGGWTTDVYTATPGVPGDSGSPVLLGDGRALGTLSTVALAPYPASNGVSGLARQLAYARKSIPGLALVKGTERFRPRF